MVMRDHADREPDIVLAVLDVVRLTFPELTEAKAKEIEQTVRAKYGGQRFRVAKRKQHPTRADRIKVFEQALTDAPTEQITQDNGISRRTLYRYLKRGGE
jgi:hypothetical protein